MIDHIVYLANTSGLKVGITRGSQVPTRWMDQGATQALPIFRVDTRMHSGTGRDGVQAPYGRQDQLAGDAQGGCPGL